MIRQVPTPDEPRRQVDPALGMGLGTPAAAALMPGGAAAGDGLPTVSRMFNLYQPYDPVAYRRVAAGCCHVGQRRTPTIAGLLTGESKH